MMDCQTGTIAAKQKHFFAHQRSDMRIRGGSDRAGVDTIHSQEHFQAIIDKERARADLNGHGFSLVGVEVGPCEEANGTFSHFVAQLNKQIRLTDEIGWLTHRSIGVLLFNTDTAGAWQFVVKAKPSVPQGYGTGWTISEYSGDHRSKTRSPETSDGRPTGTKPDQPNYNEVQEELFPVGQQALGLDMQPFFIEKFPAWKRTLDIVVSFLFLVLLAPLLVTIGLAVKYSSRGPVLFRQKRAGLGGAPFELLKFRSMCLDAEGKKEALQQFNERTGPVFKMADDPRITPLGKFLRQWSLDELPQLWNVLLGHMTLVGPRPPTMDEVLQYDSWHHDRLIVKPGITCIWQVYARHEKSFETWVRLDIRYKMQQSFWLDMKLLLLTLPAVLSRRGAK